MGEALTLAKVGSLLRNEVGWVRTGLGRVRRLKLLGQTLDLRQVFQLEWVIVGGKSYVSIFKLVCSSLEIRRFRDLKFLWCMFPRRVS